MILKYLSMAYLLFFSLALGEEPQCPDFCPPAPPFNETKNIVNLAEVLNNLQIRETNLPRNLNAQYCLRNNLNIIDTIVFHHSDTSDNVSAEEINQDHIKKSTKDDPWLMIGYHYIINSYYFDENKIKVESPQISKGRPIEMIGAHAGSEALVTPTEQQKSSMTNGDVTCGKEGEIFKTNEKLITPKGKTKLNNTSIGVVFVGNYAKFSSTNLTGFGFKECRMPNKEVIHATVNLMCKLQKEFPNLKKITAHKMFRCTQCPGTIEHLFSYIIKKSNELGCSFSVENANPPCKKTTQCTPENLKKALSQFE